MHLIINHPDAPPPNPACCNHSVLCPRCAQALLNREREPEPTNERPGITGVNFGSTVPSPLPDVSSVRTPLVANRADVPGLRQFEPAAGSQPMPCYSLTDFDDHGRLISR